MSLPTREEINVYDSLDERSACKNFLGKTLEEAEEMFRQGIFNYREDLMWMGPSAFQYYLRAAICYLQSEAANDDADMISQLATTFEFQLECHPKDLAPIAAELANDCKYILENYDRLGDLPKSETEMQERIEIMRKVLSGLGHNLNRKPEDYVDLRPRFEELLKKFLSLAEAK